MGYSVPIRLYFHELITRRNRLLILVVVFFVALFQSGCVAPGNMGVSATNLNFGGVPVGSSKSQIVTIMNSGGGPFTITNAAVSGKGFDITAPLLPLTLAVGQSAKFTMRFAPAAIGDTSGSVLITKTQISSPQLQSGSASTTPSITSQQETIAMTGAGVSVTPSITTQPASQTVTAAQTATFSVSSSGAAPLSYQWGKNGAAIPGATLATYTTPATATSDSGSQFTVVVSNSAGNVTSNTATLTVTAADVAPSITMQPANQTVTVGQTATFSVTASGTSPLNYQWRKNGTAINGATSTSYTTSAAAISDSGSAFTVAISNSKGGVTSNTATLTVNAAPIAITVTPNTAKVAAGSTQQFAGNVSGASNTAVTWTVSGGCAGAACGTISTNGLFVAPATVPSPAAVTVKATSVADPTKSASASVTIVAAVAVLLSISPTSASVPTVGTQLFSASVTGTSNTAMTWSVSGKGCSGSACGTISTSASSAVYSAPSVAPAPASVSVTATSLADPTKSASANVTVVPVVAVTVSPTSASVPTGTTQQFNASVTETLNTAVAWSVSGAGCSGVACGTINSSGLYTAPAVVPSPATVTVTATSVADPTKSSAVNLTVIGSVKNGPAQPLAITTTALPQAVTGQAYSATLQATGGTPPYTWSVASGQMPPGLKLASAGGQFAGTPTQAGAFTVSIQVVDTTGQVAQKSFSITIAVGSSSACGGPVSYCSRTDLNFQAHPSTIPNVGTLTGANTIVVPSDFNNPIVRITDVNTEGSAGRNDGFSIDSSAEVNFMNKNDDRFWVQDSGAAYDLFSWNGSTMQATRMYVSSFPSTNGIRLTSAHGLPTWSFTQPYISYTLANDGSNDAGIWATDFTSTNTPPSPIFGTELVNLTTCVPALAGKGIGWADNLSISGDDQTFATAISTGAQGSGVYVIVWNRTMGCRVLETDTGAVTGAYGGAPTGTIGISDRFFIHNARLAKSGDWVQITRQSCASGSCTGDSDDIYFWQLATLTVNAERLPSTDGSGGHHAMGYTHFVNDARTAAGPPLPSPTLEQIRSVTSVGSPTALTATYPACTPATGGQHQSWANDASGDTTPVFTSSETGGGFTPTCAWDNEILAWATDGSGTVWRFAHTFATGLAPGFSAANAIGAVSQSGKWFAWSTDWDGMLGNQDLITTACTITTNCRNDVFIVKLQ
jgi:hypothetical protein